MMRTIEIHGFTAEVAETFLQRLRGLMWRKSLSVGRGMLILHCNAIHTCFMRFAIDAIFLDKNDEVVKVVRAIRPWRLFVWGGFGARKVLEVASEVTEVGH